MGDFYLLKPLLGYLFPTILSKNDYSLSHRYFLPRSRYQKFRPSPKSPFHHTNPKTLVLPDYVPYEWNLRLLLSTNLSVVSKPREELQRPRHRHHGVNRLLLA